MKTFQVPIDRIRCGCCRRMRHGVRAFVWLFPEIPIHGFECVCFGGGVSSWLILVPREPRHFSCSPGDSASPSLPSSPPSGSASAPVTSYL